MGGSAFQSLNTPRMPSDVYELVKARCHAALRELYLCVASPIEGAEKNDFGDIDILVAWAKTPFASKDDARAAIRTALGAEDAKYENVGDHYAIAWPDDTSIPQRHIQVDLTICSSLDRMQWILFKHAHGDFWSIIGTVIRPYGLTVDEQALWLRIPDIEKFNKNKAKIHLTSDLHDILHFLDLQVDTNWDRPFASRNDLYEYATSCRMFWVWSKEDALSTMTASSEAVSESNSNDGGKKINSKDKRRMRTRPGFSKWVDEFIPRCREQGRFSEERTSRETVRDEAFARFPGAKEEYSLRLEEFLRCREKDRAVAEIKAIVPVAESGNTRQAQYRGCLIKALIQILIEGDNSYGIVPDVSLEGGITQFLKKHGDVIGNEAMARHQRKYEEHQQKSQGSQD
ncbi:hypothetical protein CCHL11_02166 [Colletotrichum chlorophyti]|uniref:Uncharacterized protein n=1 Tax=Colletotrichum chlorophyti TaxID=708187 RepID=A0A1Q8S6L6_9PEZI|nr:hypothetical protein CCHL11_02166 [Colletotrichum chlorophyti]